ncbi:hypothetical protein ACWDRB_62215 [Nonomuraea sp. NPDC003707]
MGDPARCRYRSGALPGRTDLAAFLAAQAHAIVACDFLVVETLLLKQLYVLVFIEPGTRRLHLAGVTAHPTGAWKGQQARNLAMDLGDRIARLRFLIHDRNPLFTFSFREIFTAEGLRAITTLPRTPRMNAICERVTALRRELLDRILILGETPPDLCAPGISDPLQRTSASPVPAPTSPRRHDAAPPQRDRLQRPRSICRNPSWQA